MASKLILHFHKLKLGKYFNRIIVNKHVFERVSNASKKNICALNRRQLKTIKIPYIRSKVPNYRLNLKYAEYRVVPPRIKFPNNITISKYLNKGCNGVICTIDNENALVAKQAYKFDPYSPDTTESSNENDILDKLQRHPNIIQKVNEQKMKSDICQDPQFIDSCPDVEHHGLTNTLILERMDMSLDELLKRNDLILEDRIDILAQILEAQVYMNRRSICHRDMKLSNILVNFATSNRHLKHPRNFIIKVADFDNALDLNNIDPAKFCHRGANICTAPEILNMKPQKSLDIKHLYSKNDIWAIGGMAYEIFGFENPFVKIDAQKYSMIDLPNMDSVPDVVQRVIRSLLHPSSANRYQACVATDVLQIYRLKTLIQEEVFRLVEKFALPMMVAFCYLNNLYYTGTRFMADPRRMEFVINFINN